MRAYLFTDGKHSLFRHFSFDRLAPSLYSLISSIQRAKAESYSPAYRVFSMYRRIHTAHRFRHRKCKNRTMNFSFEIIISHIMNQFGWEWVLWLWKILVKRWRRREKGYEGHHYFPRFVEIQSFNAAKRVCFNGNIGVSFFHHSSLAPPPHFSHLANYFTLNSCRGSHFALFCFVSFYLKRCWMKYDWKIKEATNMHSGLHYTHRQTN